MSTPKYPFMGMHGLTHMEMQVGDVATEEGIWARPENEAAVLRPTSTLTPLAPGSDLTGAAVAALAATAVALRTKAYGYSVAALDTATSLYPTMVANEGLWSAAYADASAVSSKTYYKESSSLLMIRPHFAFTTVFCTHHWIHDIVPPVLSR